MYNDIQSKKRITQFFGTEKETLKHKGRPLDMGLVGVFPI